MKNIKKLLLTTMIISPVLGSDPDLEAAISASLALEFVRQQEEDDVFNARLQKALELSEAEEKRRADKEAAEKAKEEQRIEEEKRNQLKDRLAQSARAVIADGRCKPEQVARDRRKRIMQTQSRSLKILNLQETTPMTRH